MAYFDEKAFPVVSKFTQLSRAQQDEIVRENKKNGFGEAVELLTKLSVCGYTTRKVRKATGSAS